MIGISKNINIQRAIHRVLLILFTNLMLFVGLISYVPICRASHKLSSYPEVAAFIKYLSVHDHFDKDYLTYLFNHAKLSADVLKAMESPYEDQPWYIYRNYFLGSKRIAGGVEYWYRHLRSLEYARHAYGVPEQIVAAIVGIESSYGESFAKYPELDTLLTLSFAYPKRMEFFRMELEQFLLLARELNVEPRAIYGSYAGALGLPQFMPHNYRAYAVSFDENGHANLFADTGDVVVSIANFLKQKGWRNDERIAVRAVVKGTRYQEVLSDDAKPRLTLAKLRSYHVYPVLKNISGSHKAALIALRGAKGQEYWLVFNNFYVLSKYNCSNNYVMAVFQLSKAIRKSKGAI